MTNLDAQNSFVKSLIFQIKRAHDIDINQKK